MPYTTKSPINTPALSTVTKSYYGMPLFFVGGMVKKSIGENFSKEAMNQNSKAIFASLTHHHGQFIKLINLPHVTQTSR